MKRAMKRVLRSFWRLTAPIRRPLAARLDARMVTLMAGATTDRIVPPIVETLKSSGLRLQRIEDSLARVDLAASAMTEEVNLVLNGLSREIFRLQSQVELLERTLRDELSSRGAPFSIVDETGEASTPSRPASASNDLARVG